MRFYDYHYSFWIPTDASIPGRMALLITAYLILTNMATSQHGNMAFDAKVFSAMDAWFYACRFFVGAAMLQFAMVIKLSWANVAFALAKPGPCQRVRTYVV